MSDPSWWRQAVVYQIYPRSFADSDGDGIGDLPGIVSRVPYLVALGVDAVWLSPFYPSALADGGYDVDDYRAVDPRLGTMADFGELTKALHAAGIKVVVDIVPNHTSNRHEWFVEALAAPKHSAARNRYIFRDGSGPDGSQPPSPWQSLFGGPAWERVADGQWYLHLFAPEQPDLNWDNREIRDDFLTTLRFWSDRGVDGFRVDVAHALSKDMTEPLGGQTLPASLSPDGEHRLWDRDEVQEIYAEWRRVLDRYDPPRTAVAEAWVHPDRRARYAHRESLGQAFNFDLLEAQWHIGDYRKIITDQMADAARTAASTTWVLSNHDVLRHATRYGLPPTDQPYHDIRRSWLASDGHVPVLDRAAGLKRARAASLLVLGLPGSAYLYQGEELGLHEVPDIAGADLQDPTFHRSGGEDKGRDGCRVPLPWTADGPSFGFGSGPAHLPQPAWFGDDAVQVQDQAPASTLSLYRKALHLRRQLQGPETLEWVDTGDEGVLSFRRPGGWQVVTNFGARAAALPGELVLTSGPLDGDGKLPQDTTAWVLRRPQD